MSVLDDTKINFFFYHYDSALRLYIRKQRRREGTLNCTRMRMERIHKKIRLLSFLLQGILSRILRSQHSRGRCAQREKDLTDYLVPRGSRNFAITTTTTRMQSQSKRSFLYCISINMIFSMNCHGKRSFFLFRSIHRHANDFPPTYDSTIGRDRGRPPARDIVAI